MPNRLLGKYSDRIRSCADSVGQARELLFLILYHAKVLPLPASARLFPPRSARRDADCGEINRSIHILQGFWYRSLIDARVVKAHQLILDGGNSAQETPSIGRVFTPYIVKVQNVSIHPNTTALSCQIRRSSAQAHSHPSGPVKNSTYHGSGKNIKRAKLPLNAGTAVSCAFPTVPLPARQIRFRFIRPSLQSPAVRSASV